MEVAVMSLSAHEQHALVGIETRLAHSDPRLASLLTTFNRLTSGEAMPAGEKVLVARRGLLRRAHWLYARLGFQRVALIVWLVLGIALVAVALGLSHGASGRACTRTWPGCAGPVSGQTSSQVVQKSATSQTLPSAPPVHHESPW
jgi:hypothetical protein